MSHSGDCPIDVEHSVTRAVQRLGRHCCDQSVHGQSHVAWRHLVVDDFADRREPRFEDHFDPTARVPLHVRDQVACCKVYGSCSSQTRLHGLRDSPNVEDRSGLPTGVAQQLHGGIHTRTLLVVANSTVIGHEPVAA